MHIDDPGRIWRFSRVTDKKLLDDGKTWEMFLTGKCMTVSYITDAEHDQLLQLVRCAFGRPHGACSHDTKVFLQAHINGKFLCADNLGSPDSRPIIANKDTASDWEAFTIFKNADDAFSLKSNANGKYLSAMVNDGGQLIARADKIDQWEKFQYATRINSQILDSQTAKYGTVIRSVANQKYVSVDPNSGKVSACADAPREWEWLLIRCEN